MAGFQRGIFQMADRVTRVPQSRELVRAKRLHQALERGAPPAFVPPVVPNPVKQPSSLSWSRVEDSGKTNSKQKNSTKTSSEETLSIRRQYLEQLFQNSPDPLIIFDALLPRPVRQSASFSACSATPHREASASPSTSLFFLPIAPPKPNGSRNASSAASTSPSKPSAAVKTAPCSTSPFPPLPSSSTASTDAFYAHLSRHLRAQARRSPQLGPLSHCRKSQRHPGSSAVLRRHPRHRRRTHVRPQFLHRHSRSRIATTQLPLLRRRAGIRSCSRQKRRRPHRIRFAHRRAPALHSRNSRNKCSSAAKSNSTPPDSAPLAGRPAQGQPSHPRRARPQKLFQEHSLPRTRQGRPHPDLAAIGRRHRPQTQRAGSAPLRSPLPLSSPDRRLRNLPLQPRRPFSRRQPRSHRNARLQLRPRSPGSRSSKRRLRRSRRIHPPGR